MHVPLAAVQNICQRLDGARLARPRGPQQQEYACRPASGAKPARCIWTNGTISAMACGCPIMPRLQFLQ